MKKVKLRELRFAQALSTEELKHISGGGSGIAEIICLCHFYSADQTWLTELRIENGASGTFTAEGCDAVCTSKCQEMYRCTNSDIHYQYERTDELE